MPSSPFRFRWFVRVILPLFLAIVGGAGSGWMVARLALSSDFARLDDRLSEALRLTSTSTASIPAIQVVSVVRRPLPPIYPDVFVSRNASPVVSLIKKTASGDGLSAERSFANAITLTSDGWCVTPAVSLNGLRPSDVLVVWNGRLYPVQKAILDTATDLVYFKISSRDLPSVALVHANDVMTGSAVWIEPKSKRLFPQIISDIRLQDALILSSEHATRRFLVGGEAYTNATGGGVWDERGQLIGVLESHTTDGWRAIPAGSMFSALTALLAGRQIVHSYAGIRSIDLASAVDGSMRALPLMGAWVHGDRRTPAVAANSPLAGRLQEGDVIERVERDTLDGTADLGERLLEYQPGTLITLFGKRKDQPMQWSLTLGSVTTSEILK